MEGSAPPVLMVAASPSVAAEEDDEPICRVCFSGSGELISPCACKGSQLYIHLGCLRQWQQACGGSAAAHICSICREPYTTPPPTEGWWSSTFGPVRWAWAMVAILVAAVVALPFRLTVQPVLFLIAAPWLLMSRNGVALAFTNHGVALIRTGAVVPGLRPGVVLVASPEVRLLLDWPSRRSVRGGGVGRGEAHTSRYGLGAVGASARPLLLVAGDRRGLRVRRLRRAAPRSRGQRLARSDRQLCAPRRRTRSDRLRRRNRRAGDCLPPPATACHRLPPPATAYGRLPSHVTAFSRLKRRPIPIRFHPIPSHPIPSHPILSHPIPRRCSLRSSRWCTTAPTRPARGASATACTKAAPCSGSTPEGTTARARPLPTLASGGRGSRCCEATPGGRLARWPATACRRLSPPATACHRPSPQVGASPARRRGPRGRLEVLRRERRDRAGQRALARGAVAARDRCGATALSEARGGSVEFHSAVGTVVRPGARPERAERRRTCQVPTGCTVSPRTTLIVVGQKGKS